MRNWPIQEWRPFEIAFLRIERANQHRLAAAKVWSDFLDEEPYHPVVRVDDDGEGELWIGLEAERLPLDIGFELGEMLYQYRAALDSSIYDANVIETGQNPPPDERALEFPICESESTFIGSRRKLGQLPREYVEFIEAIQPYNAPKIADELRPKNINRNLSMLNDWARKDRHSVPPHRAVLGREPGSASQIARWCSCGADGDCARRPSRTRLTGRHVQTGGLAAWDGDRGESEPNY